MFFRPYLITLALIPLLAGCQRQTQSQSQNGPGGPAAPQAVGVVTLVAQRVMLMTDLPGRTSPYRIAEIRPQVSGILLKRMFTEGGEVQAGQQLYQIDPAPYQAAYDSAQATLAHANAVLTSAKLLADRDKGLVASEAVSKQDFDNAVAAEQQAEADVASGQAAVETARVNLLYTKVLSPITGITGRSVTEGALVTTNQTTPLVTVQELDPIYVDIPQSTALLLRLRREMAGGQIIGSDDGQAPVTLTLEDGSAYDTPGRLQFSEVTVDVGTGSVILRAVFPNPKRILLPGLFVTAHLEEGFIKNGILAPQQGVTHNQRGEPTALVVTPENKVELRILKTDRAIGDNWLITEGLHAGDRVIVDGLQKVQPGQTVQPVEIKVSSLTSG
ncbi:MAG TPA: efflux RND transporter periplasmic adaptor subunit [Candidatus Methylacidiphilales bacterium]|nr:efflux RND transporter periplasmic adaptor subunit [Candidatus Methylacidiphilales bacterium]